MTQPRVSKAASRGFFVTGTDTDVGKTFVAANIARALVEQGFKVRVRKPIASGCILQADGSLFSEDAHHLKAGARTDEPIEQICAYQFEPAISPHLALEMAGVEVSITQLTKNCPPKLRDNEYLLVEGAGGWMSPLASDGFNRDLAIQLQLPVVLVVANKLGCLNHALLSAEAIQQAGLKLHCVVINDISPAGKTFNNYAQDLQRWISCPIYQQSYQQDKQIIPLMGFVP